MGKYLSDEKNIPILDADIYSHEALNIDQDAAKMVINRYGKAIISQSNGNHKINRYALAEIIFSKKNEKEWLEKILHPIIKTRLKEDIKKYKSYPVIAMIIPLLFEAKFTDLCNETWLIYCNSNQQYERLMLRNGLNHKQAQVRIESQLSLDKKKKLADNIIDNCGNIELCFKQIDKLLLNIS